MTLHEMLQTCGCIDIKMTIRTTSKTYCQQKHYDVLAIQDWDTKENAMKAYRESMGKEEIVLLEDEPWWNEAKEKKVIRWEPLGGIQKEIWIFLGEV